MAAFAASGHPTAPDWWRKTRAIYAAHALSGAGGPLMKFPGQDIRNLGSFENLPSMLADAGKLGCRCLYLVDYWEGGYENKGDYEPRADLGGGEALKRGIQAVHDRGGRVLLYLEAFIIHRESAVGQKSGLDWAMWDENGKPYAYYGRSKYFLMYPGAGSGWKEHLCGVAEELTRRYGVDGFHLDSYGLQWDWKDFNPRHAGATDPTKFNRAAVGLVHELRERVQRINPEAVVILEGCERTELLEVCEGGQIDSAAWQFSPLKTLAEKPWFKEKKYKAFTSHFSLAEMDRIRAQGYSFSLTPWWLNGLPQEKDFERMRQQMDDRNDWYKRILALWHWDNLLYVNGAQRPVEIDLFALRRNLEKQRYSRSAGPYDTPEYWEAVKAYEPRVRALLKQPIDLVTPARYLRARLSAD